MENILIEKTKNGSIVRCNFDNLRNGGFAINCETYVFQTKRALNKFINEKFVFDEK